MRMFKKGLVCILILGLLYPTLFAKNYSITKKEKNTWGWILTIGGSAMAWYGFTHKEIKRTDISNPVMDSSDFTWSKRQAGVGYPWYVRTNGKIKNTGNVPLKNIKIYENYYDSNNQVIAYGYTYSDIYWLDPLPVNIEDSWDDFDGGWTTEPANTTIRVEYSYDPTYKEEEIKTPTDTYIGALGIGIALWGLVWVGETQEVNKLSKKLDIEFKLASNLYTTKLTATKRF